jgi:hypothetical protein
MNIVDRARKFAERAHSKQLRKYTGEPYFVHLDEVAKLCARHGCSKRAIRRRVADHISALDGLSLGTGCGEPSEIDGLALFPAADGRWRISKIPYNIRDVLPKFHRQVLIRHGLVFNRIVKVCCSDRPP